MNHASRQSDIQPYTWRSWTTLALTGLLAGLALAQVPGSEVSAATLDTQPLEQPYHAAPAPLPEIMEALPFL